MLSLERGKRAASRRPRFAATALALVGLAVAAGCSVQPLYSTASISPSAAAGSIGGELSTISIKPVNTRVGQEVRNQLIFLFGGGQGQPAQPRYTMNLTVASISESTANVQINRENEPTAAILTVIGNYSLLDASGKPYSRGTQQFRASYDVPRQEFAAVRARRDAENRASREVAELLRMAVAQDLSKGPQKPRPVAAGPKSLF